MFGRASCAAKGRVAEGRRDGGGETGGESPGETVTACSHIPDSKVLRISNQDGGVANMILMSTVIEKKIIKKIST